MSKVDYRPQQNNTAYWRNVANEGRGSQMTQCLHEACDYVARLESENAEMAELLASLAQIDRSDGNLGNELDRAEFLRTHPEFIGYAKQARALLARFDQ